MLTTSEWTGSPIEPAVDLPPIYIRTSERNAFRRCRRLWTWTGGSQMNLKLKESADYFWFGSGIHYALEDFHGHNVYGHPATAFLAYVEAGRQAGIEPSTWKEIEDLGTRMMYYYANYWLHNRHPLNTYIRDGEPQCEVRGYVPLDIFNPEGRQAVYQFTLDRVCEDDHGNLWVVEYKTAKQFRQHHLDVDDQVTSYMWGAQKIYPDKKVVGTIYIQFKKAIPTAPPILSTGRVSTSKTLSTTSALYRQRLIELYGDVMKAPTPNIAYLNDLTQDEDFERDKYVCRDYVERNERQLDAQEQKILMEIEEMFNPNLGRYPNPTSDCGWQCPLQAACIALDDGSDYESIIELYTQERNREDEEKWRKHLPTLEQVNQQHQQDMSQYLHLTDLERDSLQELPSLTSPEAQFLQEME